jgi:hypothetical protein
MRSNKVDALGRRIKKAEAAALKAKKAHKEAAKAESAAWRRLKDADYKACVASATVQDLKYRLKELFQAKAKKAKVDALKRRIKKAQAAYLKAEKARKVAGAAHNAAWRGQDKAEYKAYAAEDTFLDLKYRLKELFL